MSKTNKNVNFGQTLKNLPLQKDYPDLWWDIFLFFASAQWIFHCEYHDLRAE